MSVDPNLENTMHAIYLNAWTIAIEYPLILYRIIESIKLSIRMK